jgi:periplasmic divalent cation tolerance protein
MLVESIDKTDQRIVFVYTTCQDKEEARYLGLSAIEDKLAICADFWEVGSLYPWHGVMQDVNQYMVMMTTQKPLAEKLVAFITGLHSYSIPMVGQCNVPLANPAYLTWTNKTLISHEPYRSAEEDKAVQRSVAEDGYHPGHLK